MPENAQTIANDLTRRDLKLVPPAELKGSKRNQWLNVKPAEVEMRYADGKVRTLTGDALVHWKYQRYMQDYLACVQSIDDHIGRVLDYLETTERAKNTIVFDTSDNGFFLRDNGMFDKRFTYEPSLRVPLLVRGLGVKAGSVSDLFGPTFLDLAGLPTPAEMKAELDRLRKEFKDDDQFTETIPPNGGDGVAKEKKPLGGKTTAVAIALTAGK